MPRKTEIHEHSPAADYLRAANRVAEMEALIERQRGKIAGLKRLGFDEMAEAQLKALARMEALLRLCVQQRDTISVKKYVH